DAFASRRALARPVPDPGQGDFRDHPAGQRGAGHVDPAGRAKCQGRAGERPLRLCPGNRPDRHERYLRTVNALGGHSGVLPWRQGSRRTRRTALEKEEDVALNRGPASGRPAQAGAGRRGEQEEMGMAGAAVLTVADTIAKSFLLAVETRRDKPAIREKKFGIWQPTSWREWLSISKDIAYALNATGFRPGDVASIMSNAVPEWVFADMGILCAGGVSSGIYPTDSASQVEYLVNDSRTRVIFVEDEEQLDK